MAKNRRYDPYYNGTGLGIGIGSLIRDVLNAVGRPPDEIKKAPQGPASLETAPITQPKPTGLEHG